MAGLMTLLKPVRYQNENGFPSWGADPDGTSVSVNTQVMPPVGTVHDPHAADGYAFCEIAYTVLKQTASQFYNSCGPTSALAALIVRSPAQAFKKALQLYYTGSLPEIGGSACPYVYAEQPGLIPFRPNQPGSSAYRGTDWCPDKEVQFPEPCLSRFASSCTVAVTDSTT